ncbi:hypothetical protein BGX24_002739 [Mortierella sp. AD032]|nr:hypothetical protein BGX24_002739 [Mortierella sp. AD032]
MDSHANPWSYQQQLSAQDDDNDIPTATKTSRNRRHSHDRKHYSYASTTTLISSDSFHDSIDNDEPHNIFFSSFRKTGAAAAPESTKIAAVFELNDRESKQHQEHQSSHVRTWSQEDTITTPSDYGGDTIAQDDKYNNYSDNNNKQQSDNDDVLDSLRLADSALDSTQSIGEPLSLAESSSSSEASPRTDSTAERTLADSGIGIEGDVIEHLVQKLQSEVANTRAAVSDLETRLNAAEHSNKHIVEELKMLLADAEGTLVGSDDSDSGGESEVVSSKHGSGSEDENNIVYNRICNALQALITDAQSALVRNPSSRSLFHLRVASPSSAASVTSSSSRVSRSSIKSAYSRIIWKEKQLEQYERYRRSCDRVSLELEMLLNDTMMDTDYADDYNPLTALFPLLTESPFTPTHPAATGAAAHPLSTTPEGSTAGNKAQPRRNGRAEALRPGSRAEKMQRSFQAQFLSPQGVGASRSQSLLMQLYGLWKQTWLRRRIMHILTGSLEVGLILWVIFKLGEASLSFMGVPLLKGGPQTWLLYVYGDRQGPGSTVAKELYEKIRRDGLKLRQVHLRRARESGQLMQEFVAAEAAASGLVGGVAGSVGKPSTPFSAAGMVWGPMLRMVTHAATGFVLAFLVDHGKRLSKKL